MKSRMRPIPVGKGFIIGLTVFVIGFLVFASRYQTSQQSPSQPLESTLPTKVLGTTDGTTATTTVGAKEFFVPFGYGTVENATDWKDVAGMRATVNTSLYPKIKQVTLEVNLKINDDNQSVWARVRNNDGHSYSEVKMDGKGPDLRLSSAFSLSPGEKTYYIQAKSSGGSPITIHQARLHIITN